MGGVIYIWTNVLIVMLSQNFGCCALWPSSKFSEVYPGREIPELNPLIYKGRLFLSSNILTPPFFF